MSLLKDLRIKVASLERCHRDFGMYVEELTRDRKSLEEAKAKNEGNVSQLEQVVSETEDMIPRTATQTQKMATGLVEFWNQRRGSCEDLLKNETERANITKALASHYKNLERVLKASTEERNPFKDNKSVEESLQKLANELKDLAGPAAIASATN